MPLPASTHKSVKDFTTYLDKQPGLSLPLFLTGVAAPPPATATMLGWAYQELRAHMQGTPPLPVNVFFGQIDRRAARLDANIAYSQAPTGGFTPSDVLQGDLLKHSESADYQYSMVLSQSCDTPAQQSPYVTLCPVYRESEMTPVVLQKLKSPTKPVPDVKSAGQQRGAIFENNSLKFVAFPTPPKNLPFDDPFVVALHCPYRIPSAAPPTPELRLSYRALAFLQGRIATLYVRDVKCSDDERDF
jgi:hypothetical protein